METLELASPERRMESFAKQAYGIPEIRDMICETINTHDETVLGVDETPEAIACSALVCLLRTSHTFFFSAVRVLWGTREIEAENLLVLLPGVSRKPWKNSSAVSAIVTTKVPNLSADTGLSRFNIYAPHIRYLRSNLVVYLHKNPQELDAIRAYAQAHTLLPNLVTLSTKGPTCSTGDDSANTLIDWLEILIPKSLRKLDLSHSQHRHSFSEVLVNRFYGLIQTVTVDCLNLNALSYCYGGAPATHCPTFLVSHTLLPVNMAHLRCRFAVFCPELLSWLARMPKLRRLEFDELDGFHSAFNDSSLIEQSSSFSELKHLVLAHCWPGPIMQLCQSPLASRLTRLDINCTIDRGWYKSSVLRLFRYLVESFTNLVDLSLDFSADQFPFSDLHVLQSLPLQKLFLPQVTRRLIGGPRVVRDLLQLWPSLQTLDLRSYDASFEDLKHIVPFGLQLVTLRLGMEMNIPYGLSNASSFQAPKLVGKFRPLTLISSYEHPRRTYDMSELDELAKYLSSLRSPTKFWTCNDRQDPWVFRRYGWLKYLNMRLDMHSEAQSRGQGTGKE